MTYWTTKGGEKISIKDMTTEHIINCIKMLQKQIDTKNTARMVGIFGVADDQDDNIVYEIDVKKDIESMIETFNKELVRRSEL